MWKAVDLLLPTSGEACSNRIPIYPMPSLHTAATYAKPRGTLLHTKRRALRSLHGPQTLKPNCLHHLDTPIAPLPVAAPPQQPSLTCTYPLVCPTRLRPSAAVSTTHTRCLLPTSATCASVQLSTSAASSRLRALDTCPGTRGRMRAAGVPGLHTTRGAVRPSPWVSTATDNGRWKGRVPERVPECVRRACRAFARGASAAKGWGQSSAIGVWCYGTITTQLTREGIPVSPTVGSAG